MTTIEKIQSEYPLHWAVWNDDHKELQDLIKTNQVSSVLHSVHTFSATISFNHIDIESWRSE